MSEIGSDSVYFASAKCTKRGKGRYRRHVNDRFSDRRTGKTLLTAIWDSEAEHWGLTPPTVPGLCGDEDKMSERCGQVATAIVQSVTPRLPDLHG